MSQGHCLPGEWDKDELPSARPLFVFISEEGGRTLGVALFKCDLYPFKEWLRKKKEKFSEHLSNERILQEQNKQVSSWEDKNLSALVEHLYQATVKQNGGEMLPLDTRRWLCFPPPQTKQREEEKKKGAANSYEAWKEKKEEMLKAKTKEDKHRMREEQKAVEEVQEKRKAAEQVRYYV